MKRKVLTLFLIITLLVIGGCSKTDYVQPPIQEKETKLKNEDTVDETGKEALEDEITKASVSSRAAWCVYWDENSVPAAIESISEYDELVLFGCIYAEDFTLFIPEALEQMYAEFPKEHPGTKVYLSFINDVMQDDGTVQQKSVDFLTRAMKDEALGDKLISDMVSQAKQWGMDGIELDYENIQKCDDLWDAYLSFLTKLYERSEQEGLLLRVVLGAYTPVDKYTFINGPQYVVMCYNLYGTHSGPGPKADAEFLQEMAKRYSGMDVTFAIANGGFEWDEQEKTVRSLTAYNAQQLADETMSEPIRDVSGAVYYTYTAEDGEHTVWYGDDETMRKWEEMLVEYCGHDIIVDLWRLE